MHGVTTALVAFLLLCVVFPNLVKNRPQYYAALAGVCLIIVLDALGLAIGGADDARIGAFQVFVYVANAFIQVAVLVVLFLACGGISWRAMASDMRDAFEVIRRGSEDKEIIIPLSGELARRKAERAYEQERREAQRQVERQPQRYAIDDPESAPPASSAAGQQKSDAQRPSEGGLPLEP